MRKRNEKQLDKPSNKDNIIWICTYIRNVDTRSEAVSLQLFIRSMHSVLQDHVICTLNGDLAGHTRYCMCIGHGCKPSKATT